MENKIDVLFIIDTLEIGGAEQSLVDIAINFKSVRATFIHIYCGSALSSKLLSHGLEVISLNIPAGYHFNKAVKKILPIIQRLKPNIIHTTLFKSDIIGRRIKKKYKVPLVNSLVNNSYIKERYTNLNYMDKFKLYLVQTYDRSTSGKVDLFISNSKAIENTNSRALNIPLNKITVIHRGRNFNKLNRINPLEVQDLKAELGINNQKVLLNVSRLLQRKGQLDLLKGFLTVSKSETNLLLIIAGEGSFREPLENFISINNLQKKVILLGHSNKIPELLNLADFFVFPSWYEGLPGALIEAMMTGTPIIASNIPENLECLSEQEGVVFKKGDVNDLVEKIHWSLENPGPVLNKAMKAKQSAIQKFDITKIASKYEEVYYNLLKQG